MRPLFAIRLWESIWTIFLYFPLSSEGVTCAAIRIVGVARVELPFLPQPFFFSSDPLIVDRSRWRYNAVNQRIA